MQTYLADVGGCAQAVEPGRLPRGGRPHARGQDPRLRQPARRAATASPRRRRTSTTTRNAAQTLANSLEILGDAQPTQANYDQVLNTFNVNSAITQLQGDVTTLAGSLGSDVTPLQRGPRPRPRRRCRAGRPGAPAPGPAPPRPRARPRRRRARTPPRPSRTMPMSVGPAPDQLAASAPASTRAPRSPGASGNSAVRAGWWMRSSVASGTSASGSARPATSRPIRPRLNTASARRERLGEHAARLGGGQVALGDDDDEGQLLARAGGRRAPAGRRPWWRRPGRRTRWPPRSRDARRRRPPPRRDPRRRRPRRPRRPARRTNPGRGRPGSASAPSRRSGRAPGPRSTTRAARCDASSKRPAPSPSLCTRSDGGLLDLDAHVAVERHGQGVEARPEVGRRRRGPGAHGRQARRVRRGAGAASRAGCPASSRTGTATCLRAER